MDKFERIGVNLLYDTTNTEEANKSFAYSCECCASIGRFAQCDRCAISCTHNLLVAYFNDNERTK